MKGDEVDPPVGANDAVGLALGIAVGVVELVTAVDGADDVVGLELGNVDVVTGLGVVGVTTGLEVDGEGVMG